MQSLFLSLAFFLGLSLTRCGTTGSSTGPANDTAYTYKTPHPDGTGKVYMGREIAHVMSAGGASWLERSTRQEEEDADAAIAALPLTARSVVADIGAGSGYYTFRISRRVPQGKVYAVEVQDEFIASLQERVRQEGAANVTVVKGGEQGPNLPDSSLDLAIMVDVYHELAYPREMLQAVHKALRPGGRLLLLEYRAEDPAIPIKALHKLSVAQAQKELAASGFELAENGRFLPMQHYLLFRKKQ
ncbi:MAG: class I SAM-dependent methyltransferase [Chitinophagaceae bacterium]|nr:MAG: class I SAM-dependent methyltransferase [Chitinophagaceae bacterium]